MNSTSSSPHLGRQTGTLSHSGSRLATAALTLFLASVMAGGAADLLTWDLTSTTGVNSGPAPLAGSAGVSGTSMTGGGTGGNSGSPANTWNRSFTTTADFTAAQAAGHFFSFSTTAAAGYTVTVSGMRGMNLSRTSIGPRTAGLFVSTDGGATFIQTGKTVTVATNSLVSAAADFADTMMTTPIVIPEGTTVFWRVVVYGSDSDNRIGIGRAGTDDFTLTGTSVPAVAAHDLVWTGAGSADWNTLPGNLNWNDTGMGNAPAPFHDNDNAVISLPAAITVDPAGVLAGAVTLANPTGILSLQGGSITGVSLTKTGAGIAALGGFNTFSAGTRVTGGVLQLETNQAAGITPLHVEGATLRTTGGVVQLTNVINVASVGMTLETEGDLLMTGAVNTVTPAANGVHVITKTGAGIPTFSATSAGAMGTQMTLDSSGGAVKLDVLAGGLNFTGSGQRNFGLDSIWDAPVLLNGGVLMLHGGSISGTGLVSVVGNTSIRSRLNFGVAALGSAVHVPEGIVLSLDSANGNNYLAVRGVIDGAGGVTKTGNGTVRLEADHAWTGLTIVEAGTLRVGTGSAGRLGPGDVILNAGTLLLNRTDGQIVPNNISGAGNVLVTTGANSTITLSGTSSYSGTTGVTAGTLDLDGNNEFSTGVLTVNSGAALGGNGTHGGAVVLQPGSVVSARISNWTGTVAGTDFEDLAVAGLDAAGGAFTVRVQTAGMVNFSETARSFPILNSSNLTNFDAAPVTVLPVDFAGTGTWSVEKVNQSLVLKYAPASGINFETWIGSAPWSLSGADAAADADPDRDGLANAVEFVLGGNPANGGDGNNRPSMSLAGGELIFTYRRSSNAVYLNPQVQYGSALTGWNPAQNGVAGVVISEGAEVEPGIREISVRLPQALETDGRLFARLRVVVP